MRREERPFYACRLEFDINSPTGANDLIPTDRREALIDEFAGIALHVAEYGQPT